MNFSVARLLIVLKAVKLQLLMFGEVQRIDIRRKLDNGDALVNTLVGFSIAQLNSSYSWVLFKSIPTPMDPGVMKGRGLIYTEISK